MSDAKKVVINVCFGGFGLSKEAELNLIGCPHVKLMEPSEYYGERDGWEKKLADDVKRGWIQLSEGKVVLDEHRSTYESSAPRECPRLIEVVESMGEKANGEFAKLRVVEIPSGIEYEIDEYDGNESIDEVHRTWR
jgi:hypothetical protein